MTPKLLIRRRFTFYSPVGIVIWLAVLSFDAFASSESSLLTCRGGATPILDAHLDRAVVHDVTHSVTSSSKDITKDSLAFPANVQAAAQDFSADDGEKGTVAFKFLSALASSPTFRQEFWHKRPLLIRAKDTGGWVQGSFTVDRDLRLIGGSYITGHCTAEILRNGTKTDTWEMRPLKDNPARKTTWEEVEKALEGGTVYFNTAGSLWPTLGALCRLTIAAFGIPTNVNVYVTPPGVSVSVPPHTDRQDVLVLQTAGAKRWRVFAPPCRIKGVDPLHRGKSGNVLSFDELGDPLIDTVVNRGDVLYVPTGFPHTTDTSTGDKSAFDETSVHLTMGLDTHVWGLTFAHMRWSLLQRLGEDFRLDIESDDAYWAAMETIPIGFLGGEGWKRSLQRLQEGKGIDSEFRNDVIARFKIVLEMLEPDRWQKNKMPNDEDIGQVVDYLVGEHLMELFEIQENMFSDIDPHDEASVVKAFECTQKQNALMEKFGGFSRNEAMRSSFAQRRLEQDEKLKGAK